MMSQELVTDKKVSIVLVNIAIFKINLDNFELPTKAFG